MKKVFMKIFVNFFFCPCFAIDALSYIFCLMLLTAGTENDLNYFEIPIDLNVETSLNEIEGRHSTDESVRTKIGSKTSLRISTRGVNIINMI